MPDIHASTSDPAFPILLCLSHLRWDFVVQRPQHLMHRAARHYRVLYWEEPEIDAGRAEPGLRLRDGGGNVTVATPLLPAEDHTLADDGKTPAETAQRRLLDQLLRDLQAPNLAAPVAVAWFYTPMAVPFAGHVEARTIVYDCMDELCLFAGASPRLLLLERRLMRLADLMFTGGRSLQQAKQHLHGHAHCFPSAVDAAHFLTARDPGAAEPADQRDIPHPRIGFFGVMDERLDTALLAAVAARRPDWHFVLLGPVAKIRVEDLPQAPNLHWLGGKSYAQLPSYLAGWDAGLMPFALNDATRFISPTKTPEFLAAGVPLVSTAIADVVAEWGAEGLVEISQDCDDATAKLARVMDRERGAWLARVDQKLAGISWDATWREMHRLIETRQPAKNQPAKNQEAKNQTAAHQATKHQATKHQAEQPAYDWLVVGAGFAGCVLAERLASQRGETVLVIDRRPHIAGNAYDCRDAAGLLIHQYGPHIFHTNSQAVVDHLSQFTEWRPYEHRVLANVDGQLVPIPINLDTVNRLYGLDLRPDELEAWFADRAEPVAQIRTSEDVVVSRVGRELYEKFFRGYTRKQWGLDPSELDRAVTARVPVRTNRDDRYFDDTFQAMPRDGYTAMFARMLDHPNITVRTGEDYARVRETVRFQRMVWTGPVDEFFHHIYGRLPYRSLRFRHETVDREQFQPVAVVNYPQTEDYTRITEYKHLTGQQHPRTSITHEYPTDEGEPYYPIPRPENAAAYRRYRVLADATPNIWFVGRLATYQYMNMDQVVGQALATYRRIDEALALRQTGTGTGPSIGPSIGVGTSVGGGTVQGNAAALQRP